MTPRYLSGHILVAPPKIIDRRFNNTVIYLVSHGESGAWGLILNKCTSHHNQEIMERLGVYIPELTGQVYAGGPVNNTSIHFLHTPEVLSMETLVGIHDQICSSGDKSFITEMLEGNFPKKYRMFAGLCSWAPGQLEGEITGTPPWTRDHSWLTAPATEEIVFDFEGMEQWSAAVEHCAQHTVRDWML